MLNSIYNITTKPSVIALAIGITLIVLIVFWSFVFLIMKRKYTTTKQFFTIQLVGIFLFGAIPSFFVWHKNINIDFIKFPLTSNDLIVYLLITLIPIILIINYLLSNKKSHQSQYPKSRRKHWNLTFLLTNTLLWIFYLISYEFLFRGLLLHACLEQFSIYESIIINTIIYSLAHVPKGKFETLGAIPLGILFCLITIWTQTFWTVCILHCIIATSNDLFCIIKNPDMSIDYSLKKTSVY